MIADDHLPQQIPLQFQQHDQYDFTNYRVGDNKELFSVLHALAQGKQTERLYIWGETELGKSHLLHATCKLAQENNLSAIYLPLRELAEFSVDVLQDLVQYDIVCIDDIQAVKTDLQWQEALFHLYNQLNETDKSLLITSNSSIKQLDLELADLSSRLNWGLVYHLQALSDEEKKVLLQQKAEQRGFELNDDVVNYLIQRVDRSIQGLLNIFEQLDQVSLSEQRKITIPFVKQLLEKN